MVSSALSSMEALRNARALPQTWAEHRGRLEYELVHLLQHLQRGDGRAVPWRRLQTSRPVHAVAVPARPLLHGIGDVQIRDFVKETKDGYKSVAPPVKFVEHYLRYKASKCPVCSGVSTLPNQ